MMLKKCIKNSGWIVLYILFSLFMAFLLEVLMTVKWDDLTIAKNTKNDCKIYQVNDTELQFQNCVLDNEILITKNDNPYIVIRDVNNFVNTLQITIREMSSSIAPVRVYWSSDGHGYEEQYAVGIIAQEDKKTFTININQYVESLRVDVGDLSGQEYKLGSLIINPGIFRYIQGVVRNMSHARMIIYFLVILITMIAIRDFPSFTKFVFQHRWVIGGLIVLFCTGMKLHGSSIGEISKHMTGVDTSNLWGTSRPVREDEYVAFSEMAFSQVKSGFKWNSNIWGYSESDMFLVFGQPVMNLVTIYRPFTIGYFLGIEYGLAFYWSARVVCCILISFEFGRILTRDDRKLSLAYAVLVAFAPIVQWWYSVNELVEMLIFGQLALVILHYYIRAEKMKQKIPMMIGLVWCAGGYILALYPAWMVPLVYVFFACLLAIIIENRHIIKFTKWDAMLLGTGIAILLLSMLYILRMSSDTFLAIMNTAYPGKRTYNGGSAGNFLEILKGWTSFLWTFETITNACEASCFISFMPIGVIASIILLFKEKIKDVWLIALNTVNLILVFYYMIGLPPIIAKITLLGKSASNRIITVIGFVNLLILIRAMLYLAYKPIYARLIISLSGIIAALSFLGCKENLSPALKMLVLIFVVLSSWIIVNIEKEQYKTSFLILSLIIGVVGGGLVNPVEKGLTTIYKAPIMQAIQTINERDKGLWVVGCNSYTFNNLPTIVGAHTMNAVSTYPDREMWKELGLESDEEIWNRYAHIAVDLSDQTYVELKQVDAVCLHVTVDDLKKLGVKYILCNSDVSEISGIKQIYSYNQFSIQQIK